MSSTGYCVMDSNKDTMSIIKTGVVQTKKGDFENEDLRIIHICKEISNIIIEYKVDEVIIEEQFLARNSKTVLLLRKMLGALMYAIYELNVKVNYLYPTTVRKLVLNNGKAKKEAVAEYIRKRVIDIGEYSDKAGKSKTSDMYDATALALAYHIQINS